MGLNDTKTAVFSPQIGAFWPQIGTSRPQTMPGGVKRARMTQNCPFLPQNRYLSARQEVVSRPRDGQIVVIAAGKLGEKSGISVKNKTPRTPSVPERPHKLPPNRSKWPQNRSKWPQNPSCPPTPTPFPHSDAHANTPKIAPFPPKIPRKPLQKIVAEYPKSPKSLARPPKDPKIR